MANLTSLRSFGLLFRPRYQHCARQYATGMKNRKLVIHEFGDPVQVVKLEEEEVRSPAPNEVLIKMLVAPLNPADMNSVQGTYPVKPSLPGVPGNEGVGQVVEVGSAVHNLKPSDLVIPNMEAFGTWQQYKVTPSDSLLKVPSEVPLIPVSGMVSNTSTAYRMLKDFAALAPGDTVIQNGANSAAGQNVIQLCRAWGYKSVNIVRDRPNIDELKKQLSCLGADVVLTEEELRKTQIFKSKEMAAPKLALNCIGGKSSMELMRHLQHNGVIVTYGGMSREPVTVPTSLLIFKNISVKGFWMTRWTRENKETDERKKMYDEIIQLMINKEVIAPNHRSIPLSDFRAGIDNLTNPKGMTGTKFVIDFRL